MKKLLIFIFTAICAIGSYAESNHSGIYDTAKISAFQGVGTGVSKAFNLSMYENLCVTVSADDTARAGFASDSVKFRWGVEFGNIVMNMATGSKDTTWVERILVDTFFDTVTNFVKTVYSVDTLGNYSRVLKFIDTVNVSGCAVQDRSVIPYWRPLMRFWYAGITGNVASTGFVKLMFAMERRYYSYTRGL